MLVATWTSWPGYRAHLDGGTPVRLELDVWVTVVPELRSFCASLGGSTTDRARRLRAYLGLPRERSYVAFAELWVRPEDVFRPCRDAETTDTACQLDYPQDTSPRHRSWFEAQLARAYTGPLRVPWTQLGYTFDWAVGGPGASEFVLRAGSDVWVAGVYALDEYCSPPGAARVP